MLNNNNNLAQMARVALLTLVSAILVVVVAAAGAAQDDPAMSLPTLPAGTPPAMLPRNLTCTSMLLGCMYYYQNTTGAEAQDPLDMCCAPARKVLDGEMYCLCDGLKNQAALAEIGIDVNKGMAMFPSCGVKLPDNVCASANNSPASSSKSVNGASQGTQFSYSSLLVVLFAMWPLLP